MNFDLFIIYEAHFLDFIGIYASDLLLNIFNNPQKAGGVNHGPRSDFYKIQTGKKQKNREPRWNCSMESFLHDEDMINTWQNTPHSATHTYIRLSFITVQLNWLNSELSTTVFYSIFTMGL